MTVNWPIRALLAGLCLCMVGGSRELDGTTPGRATTARVASVSLATSQGYAPPGTAGPALETPEAVLRASLHCTANLTDGRESVLLVPATTVTPRENFSWNYMLAFDAAGRPYCTVTVPNHAMSDMQISAEYVVYAVRAMHTMSRSRVQVVGHSQGGVLARWALRFWPDLRALVDDYIAFAPPNHGTLVADALCVPDCAPAVWQQTYQSRFVDALNSYEEAFPEVSYTVIYTRSDEFVQPNLDAHGSSALSGSAGHVTNVAVQDICPGDASEHLGVGTYDPVAYAIAIDALTHAGPADPRRVARSVCTEAVMPGVNLVTLPADYGDAIATLAVVLATSPHLPAEPRLKCYVTQTCH
jgi:pimeloyl-ACP methyl ester carboxylesterase